MLSIVLIVGSLAASIILGLVFRARASAEGSALLAGALAAFLLISGLWWKPKGFRRYVADVLGTIAVTVLAGICGSALALLGLKLQFPLADTALRSADHALGLDAVSIVQAMSRQQPWFFRLMSWGYHYTLPTVAATVVILSIFNRVEAWRVALCFAGTLMTSCGIAMFLPAKGIGTWTPDAVLMRLPGCSMKCFWPTFDIFYTRPDAVLALNAIDGVISYPSFHAAMGCIVLAAWRINLVTSFLASIWFVFLMLGTLPYGGHYLVDLAAGCAIWMIWFSISKHLERADLNLDWPRLPTFTQPVLARVSPRALQRRNDSNG